MKSLKPLICLIVFMHLTLSHLLSNHTLPIEEVIVYRNSATIIHAGHVDLLPGSDVLIIDKLIQNLNRESVQLNLGPDIIIKTFRTEIYELQIEIPRNIQSLRDSLSLLEIEKRTAKSTLEVLKDNKMIKNSEAFVEELEKLIKYQKKEQKKTELELMELGNKIKSINDRISNWQKKNADAYAKKRSKIIIHYDNPRQVKRAHVEISYISPGAQWKSGYNLYMNGLDQNMQLAHTAEIINNTGESWNDVTLKLSTVQPSYHLNRVSPKPWWIYVSGPNPVQTKYQEEEAELNIKGSRAKNSVYLIDGQRVRNVAAQEELNATNYKVEGKMTIKQGTAPKTITLNEKDIRASYYYYAAPKYSPQIYLMAQVDDVSQLDISSGRMNVYLMGKYQGSTYFTRQSTDDELEISLGTDEGVVVERIRKEHINERVSLNTKREHYSLWETTIRNNKRDDIKIRIEDHIPMSTDERIEITELDYNHAKMDSDEQILQWEMDIKSNASEVIEYGYRIRYPKDLSLNLP